MEAQASGLPVLVSDEGGPREMMDHKVSGLVLSSTDACQWANAMDVLLSDTPLRQQMGHNAVTRIHRYSLERTLEGFWMEHARCVLPDVGEAGEGAIPAAPGAVAKV